MEKELHENMTSPEFIASLPGVDRLILDPISFLVQKSTSEVEKEDGGLGHQEKDVILPQERSSGSCPEPTGTLPFEPQGPGVTQMDAQKDALPGGTQEQGSKRNEDDRPQAQAPVYQAVLPAKRPRRSLAMLDSDLMENRQRVHQGLHPTPIGITGIVNVGRGTEQEMGGFGILGGVGLLPGWPPNSGISPDFQQVMSPTCEKDPSAFGTSSGSTSQVTLTEKGSKGYKEVLKVWGYH